MLFLIWRAAGAEEATEGPGVILAGLEECKPVGVSMFRITLEVLTNLTKLSFGVFRHKAVVLILVLSSVPLTPVNKLPGKSS